MIFSYSIRQYKHTKHPSSLEPEPWTVYNVCIHMSVSEPGAPPSLSAEGGGDVPASIRKAAADGQVGAVLSWVDGGGWVDATLEYIFGDGSRESGMTLLMIAMANGHAELAEALLRRGADVSLQKSDGSPR